MPNQNQQHYVLGAEGFIAAESNAKHIVFVVDNEHIDATISVLKFFMPTYSIYGFPDYDVLPFERTSPSKPVINARIAALIALSESKDKVNRPLRKLASGSKVQGVHGAEDRSVLNIHEVSRTGATPQLAPEVEFPKRSIIVTSQEALMRKVIPQNIILQNYISARVGDKMDREELIEKLITFGFSRLVNACNASEFAVRGSIVDIVFEDEKEGYRIDFFGSKIESIRTFDPQTQKSLQHIQHFFIHPCDEVIVSENSLKNFSDAVRVKYGLKAEELIELFANHRKTPGQENFLPFFYGKLSSLFEYLAPETVIFYPYNLQTNLEKIYEITDKRFQERINFKDKTFFALPDLVDLYLNENQVLEHLQKFKNIRLNPFADNKNFLRLKNFSLERASLSQENTGKSAIDFFKEDLINNNKSKTIVSCFSNGSLQRLKNILSEYEIISQTLENYKEAKSLKSGILGLSCFPLQQGFSYQDFRIFSEQDLLGERLARKAKRKKFAGNVFTELSSFQEGDLVVHMEHGIGRFEGLQALTVSGVVRDFVRLLYAGGDKFYLPVENLELLARFGSSEDMELDKLGSAHWQMRKATLKNKIKIAAEALLKVAAERAVIKTQEVLPIEDMYEEFCNKFPYVETDDQLKAIEDIIGDFKCGKPMDRLVCGDVGFGKTEVALRAAFIAVASNSPSQVVVLVPTTLLARQHFATFTKRFEGFGIRISQLSKFTPRSEIKHIKEALESGSIDIVIGTHALLAKDVKFKNLGLIIIDEEQHFGVGQKERLKEIKSHSNVLTLSATPIPRTLQLSLTGIKELSIIATSPNDRLPIKTFVTPYDALTIREAILREYYRGGRVFYVTPRIAYLDGIVDMLTQIVPEVKVQKAHGKLSASELDKIMNDFYDAKFNVLVSTTIVESGLDIQNANTLIVDRSHMFGLSQLYQIRGRIGRGNAQAFAYLTYPDGMNLSGTAEKRLQILQSFENLGSGFSIASHDMDLRGHGNLVGEEQSGHVKEVGVELYQHMLEEAISKLKDNSVQDSALEEWSPIMNLKISVQIPEDYIPDSSLRLSLYRRIANISEPQALEDFASELIDRFGNLPIEADHLITIVKLKHLAKNAGIEKLDIGDKGIAITFRDNMPKSPDVVMNFVARNTGTVKIRENNKLLILGSLQGEAQIIQAVEKILRELIPNLIK
ncbi:MAG: mfd [Candidatus Midichloriaceae bacterium]|nr:mfd [Candidatus Midichloriaceae bacterium]